MNIAFYAPLKAPDHPVPSGDRQMARLLMSALRLAGHQVEIASEFRSFGMKSDGADEEIERISKLWREAGKPGLWFCYHPYYKAPDYLGPHLARAFDVPYATAEASYSKRRDVGEAVEAQKLVVDSVRMAKVNICFTQRDREGLRQAAPDARFEMLPPFIDTSRYEAMTPEDHPTRLVTVAMMRKGDKFDSYQFLAAALARVADLPWTLEIIGDGPLRAEVMALFGSLPAHRISWLGEVNPEQVPGFLQSGGLYIWPGCGEAYGLAYLEAEASGLPVVAQETAGVPEVVMNQKTGLLTPAGNIEAYAAAIRRLLMDGNERRRMTAAARRFVLEERSLEQASKRLAGILS